MPEILLKNVRRYSDIHFRLSISDGEVPVSWDSTTIKRLFMYSEKQRGFGGKCSFQVNDDPHYLDVTFRADNQRFLGIHRVVIQIEIEGNVATYDARVCNIVASTSNEPDIYDEVIDVPIQVSAVDTTVLYEILAACREATIDADEATQRLYDALSKLVGGTIYQVLRKRSNDPLDFEWETLNGIDLEQEEGAREDAAMSQKATTDALAGKQSAIADLEQIRQHASAGQTASDNLNGHTVGKNVPSDAKFTDTVYDDTGLRNRIGTVESKVPAQASADNKLADKDFVNSTVNSMAAFYITANASGAAFTNKTTLLAGPYYHGGAVRVPTKNDYALVNSDETQGNAACRYVYDGAIWAFQYKVNDTPFTAAQLAAINSGITQEAVLQIAANVLAIAAKYTKPETGIPLADLAQAVRASLDKADSAYQKPSAGIPAADMAEAVQIILNNSTSKEGDEMAALAIILNSQNSRIEALENALRHGLKSLIVDELEIRHKFNQFVSVGNSYLRGAGAPSADVVPENWNEDEYGPWTGVPQFVGQRYLNTSTNKWYTAKGNSAVSDWVQDTNA